HSPDAIRPNEPGQGLRLHAYAVALSAAALCLPFLASVNPHTPGIQPPQQQVRMQIIEQQGWRL
ncbi:MAG: hypothetical protein P8011_17490, partial [Acidihalobacter sp.]|uniref:hypothetical protein n=1 Tax=Acidihalobacter sp. TaxID=1872108 RepID=UPI00307E590A